MGVAINSKWTEMMMKRVSSPRNEFPSPRKDGTGRRLCRLFAAANDGRRGRERVVSYRRQIARDALNARPLFHDTFGRHSLITAGVHGGPPFRTSPLLSARPNSAIMSSVLLRSRLLMHRRPPLAPCPDPRRYRRAHCRPSRARCFRYSRSLQQFVNVSP